MIKGHSQQLYGLLFRLEHLTYQLFMYSVAICSTCTIISYAPECGNFIKTCYGVHKCSYSLTMVIVDKAWWKCRLNLKTTRCMVFLTHMFLFLWSPISEITKIYRQSETSKANILNNFFYTCFNKAINLKMLQLRSPADLTSNMSCNILVGFSAESDINMFADDIALYRIIWTASDYHHFQDDVNSVAAGID